MSSDQAIISEGAAQNLLARADSALSTDFCPWANKYVYWLKNPFAVLLLAIAGSVACAVMLNPLVILLTAILVAITAIGVILPWLVVRGIDCTVAFDVPRTQVGNAALVRLIIRNRWPIPVWGLSLIQGFAEDDGTDGDEGVALARVPGWSTVEYSWDFRPRRRGAYPNQSAEVETGFPFGLFRARKAAAVEGSLIVWPATVRLEGIPDTTESQHSEERFSERRVGEFGDMMGTRHFREGDSLRRVHWAQTARQGTMIVTERQAPAMASVRVVLDLSTHAHPSETRQETVESCVQVAASICESLHRQHSRVELVIGDEIYVAGERANGMYQAMDALAVANVTSDSKTSQSSRDGFQIVVTTAEGIRSAAILHNRNNANVVVGSTKQAGDFVRSGHEWIEIGSAADVQKTFAEDWRRACHAI